MSENKQDITELLKQNTFQGMSDDEISSIIQKNTEEVENKTRYLVKQEMLQIFDDYMQQFYNVLITKNDETLKSLIDSGQNYLLTTDAEGNINEK